MPLNINGVDPLNVIFEKDGISTDLEYMKDNNGNYFWSKGIIPTVTVSGNSGNCDYIFTVESSPYHGKTGNTDVLRYGDTYTMTVYPPDGYYINSCKINGQEQKTEHYTADEFQTDNLTVSGQISVSITLKHTYVLTLPKVNSLNISLYCWFKLRPGYKVADYNNIKNPDASSGTEARTYKILEGEVILARIKYILQYNNYNLKVTGLYYSNPEFGDVGVDQTTVHGDITVSITLLVAQNYSMQWSGNIQSGWIRNGSDRKSFTKTSSNNLIWGNDYLTSANGNLYKVKCVSWMSFGTKSNQSAESGDRTLTTGAGWSGSMKHGAIRGSFSMSLAISGNTGTVTFNGSSMGAYYAIGHIKSWSGLIWEEKR